MPEDTPVAVAVATLTGFAAARGAVVASAAYLVDASVETMAQHNYCWAEAQSKAGETKESRDPAGLHNRVPADRAAQAAVAAPEAVAVEVFQEEPARGQR